ncbi:MAG: uroporphyrinogen-III C-methyltransferase [Henriciella sp.]|nr:uroporphyrinogen-III C-methyltransferase [Henriciella sp.]MBO6694802.1 uroporphyrinogen-III C-methyltransferase [Henriciella sp.]
MRLFPAFFYTDDAHVTVFGGGEEARRKVRLLAKTTLKITVVIDTEIEPGFAEEFAGRITIAPRDMAGQALDRSKFAIIACRTNANTEQSIIWAREYGIPINVVDQPEDCDFTVPSILERGEIVAAVGSGGAAPVLAKRVRTSLEALMPQNMGPLSEIARDFRPRVYEVLDDGKKRRQFWEAALNGAPADLALEGKFEDAKHALETLLQETAAPANQIGPVHIVGAGPGDPELLTLKAFRLIQNADVVFHDRLVSDEIMDLVRRDATRVSVGKAKSNHSVPQDKIHDLMIAAAKSGQRVVRLKGGDPFVFGRGGEEVEALRDAGLEASVVPGISSALGCAASAGLPLTHRDHAQTLTFVTGHAKTGEVPDLDWASLAKPAQTVVVFMGVGTAPTISEKLIHAGRANSTPVAVIENGTRPNEIRIFGTLAELPQLITRAGIKGPALLIIGEVSAIPAEALAQLSSEAAA